jgi:hypothetical protein
MHVCDGMARITGCKICCSDELTAAADAAAAAATHTAAIAVADTTEHELHTPRHQHLKNFIIRATNGSA